MSLIATLRAPALNSLLASGFGMLGTLVVVWMAGPQVFAHYAIDLARLSLVGLLLEVVPSAYTIYHIQKDAEFRSALGAFSGVATVALALLTLALSIMGAFSSFSMWIVVYAAFLPAQRYIDTSLQADGQVARYFFLTMAVNATRVVLLILGLSLWPLLATDVVWGSVAIASWLSVAAVYMFDRTFRSTVARRSSARPFHILWGNRRSYVGYYLNAALKRIRDSLMMLICGSLVGSPIVVAQYALVFRGIDFVCGQFRIAEAALSNYENRRKLAHLRGRGLAVLSVLGQAGAIVLSSLLALQAGPLDWPLLATIALASFVIYPYVVEVTLRSDAYAAFRPRRVTLSIIAYIFTVWGVVLAWTPWGLDLTALVVAQLLAQLASAAVYIGMRGAGTAPRSPDGTDAPLREAAGDRGFHEAE